MTTQFSFYILFLVVLLYYGITKITHDSFVITDDKSKRDALNGIKKWKQMLTSCKKDNIVVVIKSINEDADKKLHRFIKEKFKPDLVTIISFTNQNIIKDFLSSATAETVEQFPAYFRINTSSSKINHLNVVHDKQQIVESIAIEIEKYKSKDKDKNKDKDKKGIGKDINKGIDKGVDYLKKGNLGKDIGKGVDYLKKGNVGKDIKGIFKKKKK
jgi:hypothetical protein